MMLRISIATARFALSAWVGAAALFIVTSVREVRSPELDSIVRDVLVGVRFPAYYLFGFALVGLGFLATLAAGWLARRKRGALFGLAAALLVALGIMVADYVWVYEPLLEMITPPGQSRPAEFTTYHKASMWMNFGAVFLAAFVAFVLCGQFTETPREKSQ